MILVHTQLNHIRTSSHSSSRVLNGYGQAVEHKYVGSVGTKLQLTTELKALSKSLAHFYFHFSYFVRSSYTYTSPDERPHQMIDLTKRATSSNERLRQMIDITE